MASKDKTKMYHIDLHTSLLNVLKRNLEIANRVTFIHRVIYVGDHSFEKDPSIADVFGSTINLLKGRGWEPLSGLLLHYSRYYVHMVERFFKKWGARFASPPTLLTTLDTDANADDYLRIVQGFLDKVYNLCKFLQIFPKNDKDNDDDDDEDEDIEDIGKITYAANDFLPEFALIDYLLNSNKLLDINTYIGQYKFLSELAPFRDNVWPIEFEKVPFDVFDIPQDPIEDLLKVEENISEPEEIELEHINEIQETVVDDEESQN